MQKPAVVAVTAIITRVIRNVLPTRLLQTSTTIYHHSPYLIIILIPAIERIPLRVLLTLFNPVLTLPPTQHNCISSGGGNGSTMRDPKPSTFGLGPQPAATTTDIHPLHSSCSMRTWLNNFIARQPWIYNAIILCHSCCSHVKVLNQVPNPPLGDNRGDVVSMNLFIQTTTLSFHWNHKRWAAEDSPTSTTMQEWVLGLWFCCPRCPLFLLSTMLFLLPINASLPAFYLNNPNCGS